MRILIAEDEKALNRILVKQFTKLGYSVDSCYDGESVSDFLAGAEYDAIVMDVMMPKKDGFEVLRDMRAAKNQTPVIFLTAKTEISDRVFGLDLGANDYLIKPFSFEELAARVRMITRDSKGNSTNVFTVADLTVDVKSREVKRAGRKIELSAREYSILEALIRNAGAVMTRERIESSVWNYDYEGGTNVIDVYIRYLRKKIDDGYDKKLIHTVRGAGYILREGE
ncbi:MAG: response regulator transcription factor [Ruminococcaceae bacterium]|nr:response regulator transcription factor [Oscillospiraceae bacterium]MBQ9913660.1 response regulator transcription factor [Clostridia bacterium]